MTLQRGFFMGKQRIRKQSAPWKYYLKIQDRINILFSNSTELVRIR